MATKYFCDGCDRDLGNGIAHNRRRVLVSDIAGGTATANGEYDLCNSCAKRLNDDANPSRWMRCASEKPNRAA